jgi:hypothetical protein
MGKVEAVVLCRHSAYRSFPYGLRCDCSIHCRHFDTDHSSATVMMGEGIAEKGLFTAKFRCPAIERVYACRHPISYLIICRLESSVKKQLALWMLSI